MPGTHFACVSLAQDHMPDRVPMEIDVRHQDGVTLLDVYGRLTIGEPAEQLLTALEDIIDKGSRKVVVLLDHVPQIDSSGLSTLVRISIALAREGGHLR